MTIVEKRALRYPEIGERGYDQCEAEDEKDRPAAGLSFVSVFLDTRLRLEPKRDIQNLEIAEGCSRRNFAAQRLFCKCPTPAITCCYISI